MRKIYIILIVLALIAGVFLYLTFEKSNMLISKGDLLLQQNKAQEALLYYEEAANVFPFRLDVHDNINSVNLLMNSQAEYSEIVDEEYAESQTIPRILPNAPPVSLKDGEYFIPILMYHHIRINPMPNDPVWASLNVDPKLLDNELSYLKNNKFSIITLDDLPKIFNGQENLPKNPIILTFDDGYEDFYTNAFPLLQKYNFKATEFVITQVETAPAYLSWDQIISLDKSGTVQIEAHTRHHPFLTDLTATLIDNEIMGSKQDIESHLGHSINWFAYPYGDYNNFIIGETQRAGFVGAVSTVYSAVQSKDKIFILPRVAADGRLTLDEFAKRIQK